MHILAVFIVLALATSLGVQPVAAASAAPSLPGAPGCPIFPLDNVWNRRVDALPVRADSSMLVATIGLDRYLHPDFSSIDGGSYGIPYNIVGSGVRKKYVQFTYASESDKGPYPIPRRPKIENGSDRHMLIVDREACRLYELYAARIIRRAITRAAAAIRRCRRWASVCGSRRRSTSAASGPRRASCCAPSRSTA